MWLLDLHIELKHSQQLLLVFQQRLLPLVILLCNKPLGTLHRPEAMTVHGKQVTNVGVGTKSVSNDGL